MSPRQQWQQCFVRAVLCSRRVCLSACFMGGRPGGRAAGFPPRSSVPRVSLSVSAHTRRVTPGSTAAAAALSLSLLLFPGD